MAGLPGAANYGCLGRYRASCGGVSGFIFADIEESALELHLDGGPSLERVVQGNALALYAAGSWTARFASVLESIVGDAEKLTGTRPNIYIDVSDISKLDTFGAWLIERLRRSLTQGGAEAKIAGLSANYSSLVDEVGRVKASTAPAGSSLTITGMLAQVGRSVAGIGATLISLIDMLGAVLAASGRVVIHP